MAACSTIRIDLTHQAPAASRNEIDHMTKAMTEFERPTNSIAPAAKDAPKPGNCVDIAPMRKTVSR